MGFFNSLSIQRINELFSDSIDQNFDCIIRDLFQLESIKTLLLRDVLITIIRGSHSFLLRTDAIIHSCEMMELILQLERE